MGTQVKERELGEEEEMAASWGEKDSEEEEEERLRQKWQETLWVRHNDRNYLRSFV